MEDLQNRLFDAEKLLVFIFITFIYYLICYQELTVHQGKQKLESIEQAQQGKYAHTCTCVHILTKDGHLYLLTLLSADIRNM